MDLVAAPFSDPTNVTNPLFPMGRLSVVADTSGILARRQGRSSGVIMPASPQVGDDNRPENIPGLVWEEVAIKTVGQTVQRPRGPVTGAMVGRELHDDGTFSDKTFAPGYGEFLTAHEGDVEALALAIPTDSVPGPPPAELVRLSRGAKRVLRLAAGDRLGPASRTLAAMRDAWRVQRAKDVPPRLCPRRTGRSGR